MRTTIRRDTTKQLVAPLKEAVNDYIVQAGATLNLFIPLQSRKDGEFLFRIFLRGEGADAKVYGAGVLNKMRFMKLTVDTVHEAPKTNGSTLVKTIVDDEAKFEFFGMIKILKDAQGSNDFLEQDSLLLSEQASANAVPGLEIEANEVKASHAATAAPINQEQLFYLRSRGIPEADATKMVAEAFLAPAMKTIDQRLRTSLVRSLQWKSFKT